MVSQAMVSQAMVSQTKTRSISSQEAKQVIWAVGGTPYGQALCDRLSIAETNIYYTHFDTMLNEEEMHQYSEECFNNVIASTGTINTFIFMDSYCNELSILDNKPQEIIAAAQKQLQLLLTCSQLVTKKMIQTKITGSLLALCSLSSFAGRRRMLPASTTAGAILGFYKSLAKEMGPYNISANIISYGFIEGIPAGSQLDESEKKLVKLMGFKEQGNLQSLVEAIQYLSKANNYVTGQNLNVDGGLLI